MLTRNQAKDFCPECDSCIPNGSMGPPSTAIVLSSHPRGASVSAQIATRPPFSTSHHSLLTIHCPPFTSHGPTDAFDKA